MIRKAFVHGMRQGETLAFDLEVSVPDFAAYTTAGTFDPNVFFSYEEFNKEEVYKSYVREEENYSIGGLNKGHYFRSEDFGMVMRSGVEDEATLQEQISKIPRFYEDFHHVIIE